MPDPIHQFEIHPILPIEIFGWDVSFTNSSLFMLVAVLLIAGFFMRVACGRARWCRTGCSRWPRSPTSSWRACCARAPGRRA